ncbi:MAG: hypothetical protein IJD30_04210, partial [Clostridia bacterium]|nr:hypothetical protein [Clostridia bacterium]
DYELSDITFDFMVNGIMSGVEEYKTEEKGIKEIGSNAYHYLKSSGVMEETEMKFEIYATKMQDRVYIFGMICSGSEYKYAEEMSEIMQSVIFI